VQAECLARRRTHKKRSGTRNGQDKKTENKKGELKGSTSAAVVIVRILGIPSVVRRKTMLILVVVRHMHAGAACELLHLGLRARASSKVGISANGRELGRASGEVVIRDAWDGSGEEIGFAISYWADAASGHVLVSSRVE